MSIDICSDLFAHCFKLRGRAVWLLLTTVLLAACNSHSAPTAIHTDATSGADVSASRQVWLQIVPAQKPDFDLSIHDYVIDCNATASIDLTATEAGLFGFVYLGTTMQPTAVEPDSHTPFRRTLQLKPGQSFRFSLARHGIYSVRCLPADFPPLSVSRNGSPQAEWYVFAPDIGGNGAGNFVIITDSHGTPVWWLREPAQFIVDAKVLDSNHIAWARINAAGSYYIRNFSGQIVNTLTDNLDIHDLQLTGNGTYFAIRYVGRICPPDCADMSAWGGSAQMAVMDAEIVELDQSSSVLWTWRTRDHIDLSEAGASGWFPGVGNDIIHMNSLEIDGADGLIFSARHLNAVYRIVKSTGAIDWKLGGTTRPESLTVLGDVRPTAVGANGQVLSGQHDARRWSDGTISIHDNGTRVGRPPSVLRYRLDLTNRTAEVVQEISDDRVSESRCCGSARLLPGGNWLVEWGGAPFMTELDPSGNPVLTIDYNVGPSFSYRAVAVAAGTVAAATLRNGMDAMYRDEPGP
jgi:hypothetical protein